MSELEELGTGSNFIAIILDKAFKGEL